MDLISTKHFIWCSVIQSESIRDCCESKINEIVYSLYDLPPEEIKIVEAK